MRRLTATILAAVIIAVGCGDATDESGGPTSEAPTDSTSTTAEPLATAEAPAEGDDSGGPAIDPGDHYFELWNVLDVEIEIADADWDTLRHQTRTLEEVIAEITEYGLSRPFTDIYSWFSATVTVNGETHADVGMRKNGFVGSQSERKPSLKLRFDRYVDDQSLGGVMDQMTLDNSIQDDSMVNTCMSYRVFAATQIPAPRCNFATVAVNGRDLGLYVHVEEYTSSFLLRHFDNADGNLYQGTVSDFTPTYRGTFEKRTNTDEADWSDIDAVVAALGDQSAAGLEALGDIVDLDSYLTHWATEVLVGHWDGYAGDRNNYWFYREPGGRFVFLPWGTADTFHLRDDPNPFDDVSKPPPSVLALTAIPNRLYNHPDWQARYAERLKLILETVWDTDELLAAVDEMAAVVQQHAPLNDGRAAAADTERVRKFILKRGGEILADLTPEPPDWPEPAIEPPTTASGTIEVSFETAWGTNLSAEPLNEGTVLHLSLNGSAEPTEGLAVLAGHSSEDEQALLPQTGDHASVVLLGQDEDGSLNGMTLVLDIERLVAGARLVIGEDLLTGGVWTLPPGAIEPDSFLVFTEGALELSAAGTADGEAITGTFKGVY